MPTIKKAPNLSRAAKSVRERTEQSEAISRVTKSLEAAQADLERVGGSLGAGASDLRRDVTKLVRDAHRGVTKMSNLVRRDLERLQKDVTSAASGNSRRRGVAKPASTRSATATRRASSTKSAKPAAKSAKPAAKSARPAAKSAKPAAAATPRKTAAKASTSRSAKTAGASRRGRS